MKSFLPQISQISADVNHLIILNKISENQRNLKEKKQVT